MTKPPKQTERSIQKSIRLWLISQGYEVIKLTTMRQYGSAGWPDLMVLDKMPRPPLFLEIKTESGVVTPFQMQRIKTLRDRGYPTFVVRSLPTAKIVVGAWREFKIETQNRSSGSRKLGA